MKFVFPCLACFLGLGVAQAAEPVRRWVDAEGRTHYSDRAPTDVQANDTRIPSQYATGDQPSTPPQPRYDVSNAVQVLLLVNSVSWTTATSATPQFRVRDDERGRDVPARIVRDGDQFFIVGLRPGRYALSVEIDAQGSNPPNHPGDLYAWKSFSVGRAPYPLMIVGLQRLSHVFTSSDSAVTTVDPECAAAASAALPPGARRDLRDDGVLYDDFVGQMNCVEKPPYSEEPPDGSRGPGSYRFRVPPAPTNPGP